VCELFYNYNYTHIFIVLKYKFWTYYFSSSKDIYRSRSTTVLVIDCTINKSNIHNLVKASQTRGLKVQILVYLDLSANLNYSITNGWFENNNANICWW